jgi:hypothetical protein
MIFRSRLSGYLYWIMGRRIPAWCSEVSVNDDADTISFSCDYNQCKNEFTISASDVDKVLRLPNLYTMKCIKVMKLEKDFTNGDIEPWRIFTSPYPLKRDVVNPQGSIWLSTTRLFKIIYVYDFEYLSDIKYSSRPDMSLFNGLLWAGPIPVGELQEVVFNR